MSPVLIAVGFAFAAAVQPGPLQAFFLSQVASNGWRRTLPAAFSPLLSDGPIALLVLLVLKQLPPGATRVLQLAGGLLLVWLAIGAYREWKKPRTREEPGTAPRTLLKAALVNILNPNPYLGWSLVLGPLVLDALKAGWPSAAAIVLAFYATMVVMLAAIIMIFGSMQLLGRRVAHVLLLLSAMTLAALGAYQIVRALELL